MGVDLPDEADVSPDGNADRRDEQDGGRPVRPGLVTPKPRPAPARTATTTWRQQCLRKSPPRRGGSQPRNRPQPRNGARTTEEIRWMWSEYKRRWPAEERAEVKRPDDAPGSWRGEGDRSLNPEANSRVEAACDQIADREREKISPAMRAMESQDPDRHLIGFERCLKERDRIKEKVYSKHGRVRLLSRRSCLECVGHDPIYLSVPRSSLYSRCLGRHRTSERAEALSWTD